MPHALSQIFGQVAALWQAHPAAQAVGFAGMALGCASFQGRTPRHILLLQGGSGLFWTIHFVLLGAPAGALFNFLGIIRNAVYARRGRDPRADSLAWPLLFSAAFAVVAAYSRYGAEEPWFCLLALAAQLLSTFSLRSPDAQRIRLFSVAVSLLWMAYDGLSGSIPGVGCEVFNQLSLYAALLRYARRRPAGG